jgi:hypothetical protein
VGVCRDTQKQKSYIVGFLVGFLLWRRLSEESWGLLQLQSTRFATIIIDMFPSFLDDMRKFSFSVSFLKSARTRGC